MDNTIPIKHLDKLLQPYFDQSITIEKFTTKPLTAAGENYGSLMLSLEIVLKESNGSSKETTLNLVAKMCPPNEWIKEMFNIGVTFKKEAAMYTTIFPTLREFQKEQGVSNLIACYPKCYGARVSLDPNSDTVDDDALILLENLKLSGYEVVDRMQGFDLETTRLLLKDLAVFHAVPVAVKLLKPDVFNKKILPHLSTIKAFDSVSDDVRQSVMSIITDTAKLNEECVPLIPKISKALELCEYNMRNPTPPTEPFATINHNDFWVNNTMLKFEGNKPVHNKIVDFQLIEYGSPAKDIVFFLFSSVQNHVLNVHYDELIQLYYDTFIDTLQGLKCDVTPFTFKVLQEEIDFAAKSTQFFHVMLMLRPMYAHSGKVKELSEMSEADLVNDSLMSDEYIQKVPEKILHFAKRNWI